MTASMWGMWSSSPFSVLIANPESLLAHNIQVESSQNDWIKIYQTCKLQIHQLIPYAFECLQSLSEGWINEQERYYYFNRRHQEIKPCGRLCEWREEVSLTVRLCVCMCTSAHVCECVHAYMQVCVLVCVTIWNRGREELIYKNRRLRNWSKKKKERHSCMHIDTLARVLVWFCASVCQWLSLKSEEKRLVFPCLCFIQQDTHIHRPKHIHNELWLHSFEQREGGVLFIHLFYKAHTQQSTNQRPLFVEQHNSLTISGIPLWMNSPCWCP